MLNFDEGTIRRLKNPKTKVDDKLYLIARYIEEKYQFENPMNYWDSGFDSMKNDDKIFYKLWLWMCYIEYENLLIQPIIEFETVFGTKNKKELLFSLENGNNVYQDLEEYYTPEGEGGEILLEWGLSKLKTTYSYS